MVFVASQAAAKYNQEFKTDWDAAEKFAANEILFAVSANVLKVAIIVPSLSILAASARVLKAVKAGSSSAQSLKKALVSIFVFWFFCTASMVYSVWIDEHLQYWEMEGGDALMLCVVKLLKVKLNCSNVSKVH